MANARSRTSASLIWFSLSIGCQPLMHSAGGVLALLARFDVEPDGDPFKSGFWCRIAPQYQRIMAGDHMLRRGRQPLHGSEAFQHVADIVDRRVGPHLL